MKVFLRTYGCQMNERDSENIEAHFIEMGHEIVDDEKIADISIVNTCSVREQAEHKAIGKLGHLIDLKNIESPHGKIKKNSGLPIVGVTGCMAQNRGRLLLKNLPDLDFIAGARQTHRVVDMALEMHARRTRGEVPPPPERGLRRKSGASDALVDISDNLQSHNLINRHDFRKRRVCAFISIMQGCGMNCSYCIVPKVRGIQRSRPLDDIVDEAKLLADHGAKEITLLGQVANAYGRDFKDPKAFSRLLERLDKIEGISRIRFVSPHPSYFKDDLISLYGSLEKLCEYVHLPMQSGSDEILKSMNRPYTAKRFFEIAQKLRARVPRMSISTDVIVGYPNETEEQFQESVSLFKDCAFDMAYIFKYSPRKGTPSADALPDNISEDEKERRNQILLEELRKQSLAFNESYIGESCEVLVEARAKRGENMFMGRTRTHRKVIFKGEESDIGNLKNVKILSASVSALEGDLA